MKKDNTKKTTPKDYGRWDRTPIEVVKKPSKKVKRGK
jgi:hypothetical protein